jgi:DUF1680 family protein
MSDEAGRRGIVVDTRSSKNAMLRPVPLTDVKFADDFWEPRRETTRRETICEQLILCESTGRIDNFRRASGRKQIARHQGLVFNDSDVYKTLEAAGYALLEGVDAALEELIEATIDEIAAAQQPDGYLNTYFMFEREGERYTDLTQKHELYCYGHMIQAAIAHRRGTDRDKFFEVAVKVAEHLLDTFGQDKRQATDGHEEIELALAELYRETGERKYMDLAIFFLDQRGKEPSVIPDRPRRREREYFQDHLPVREQSEVKGHAVRAMYMTTGMADVVLEGEDQAMEAALHRLWDSTYSRKAYVTGALGSRYEGEAFGDDYELPNERAYAETCAAIGAVFWNWRMLARYGDAKYADAIETALYNSVISGVSLDGQGYFYMNPLASPGGYERDSWFECSCCPPNVARLMMSLPSYAYSTSDEGLWVHLYVKGSVVTELPGGGRFGIEVDTKYPWEGTVRMRVTEAPEGETTLVLRIPGWVDEVALEVNGADAAVEVRPGSYARIARTWRIGDEVRLELSMEVRRLRSNPRVLENRGHVALARGPVVYCVEEADHPEADVYQLGLARDSKFAVRHEPELLGGVAVLEAEGVALNGDRIELYQEKPFASPSAAGKTTLRAIPYHVWANRGPGAMRVWIPEV